ncbi:MAG: hypothetical protein SH819_01975 [Cytophagales bacterium]|nr:hypothetical protein [Cytophagales bacterium]
MKSASLSEIKKALEPLGAEQVAALCLRLAKYKVENKEMLTYLLFEAGDEQSYLAAVKQDIIDQFASIPNPNLYFVKKSLRKILRMVNKQVRFSGTPTTELELRLQFCISLKESGIPWEKNTVIKNLYAQQVAKIRTVLETLPEDLQFDYQSVLHL